MRGVARAQSCAAIAALVVACLPPEGALAPSEGAHERTVVTEGVAVSLEGVAWPHDVAPVAHVTPLRLTIDNQSGRVLQVRAGDLALRHGARRYVPLGRHLDHAMRATALPDHDLRERGFVAGVVYFRGPPASLPHVTFRMPLIDAETGERFGVLEVPVDITRDRAAVARANEKESP